MIGNGFFEVNISRKFATDEQVAQRLFSQLRFLAYDGDLAFFSENEDLWGESEADGADVFVCESIKPISLSNEKSAITMLQLNIQMYASKFPNGPDEDKALLADPSKLSFNKLNIIRTRLDEKELCMWYIQFCSFVLQLLELPLAQAKDEFANRLPAELACGKLYFTQDLFPAWEKF